MPQTLDQIFQDHHDIITGAKKTEAEAAAVPHVVTPAFKPTAQLSSNYQGDVNKARIANVTNPQLNRNPLQFQNSTDRQAATLARIQHLMDTPAYKALTPERQTRLRSIYYDRFVAPAYSSGGFKAPDKNLWVDRITKSGYSPSDFYLSRNMKQVVNAYAGIQKAAGDIYAGATHAGIWLNKEDSMAHLGLMNFFHSITGTPIDVKAEEEYKKSFDIEQAKIQNISNDVSDSATFWLQTHPSKSWVDKMDSVVGEQLIQLPLYESIGAVREVTQGALEATGKMQNLTEWLKASPKGAFVARRVGDAFDGLVGSVLQNQTTQEKISSTLGFAGFGAASEGVNALALKAVASMPLIKKWTAEVLFNGGRPLQQAITDQAAHELEHGIVGTKQFDINSSDALQQKRIQYEQEDAMNRDPIREKLIYGEKVTLNSLAHTNFGTTYGKLTKEQQFKIRALRKQATAQAIDEAPIHLPDIAEKHTQNLIDLQKKLDPGFAESVSSFEQTFGIKVAHATVDAEAAGIKSQTGIKSSQGATEKTAKSSAYIERQKTIAQAKARKEEPIRLANLEARSSDFFRNPTQGMHFKSYMQSGGKDYESYLAGISDEDFVGEIKDHLGNQWFFEDPKHTLVWAWQYKHQMPPALSAKLKDVLDDIDPVGTPASWTVQANGMAKHLKQLATTGRLYTEGNVFRSSNFGGKPTIWQKKLEKEANQIEQKQLQAKLSPLKRNHKGQFVSAQKILNDVQSIVRPARGGQ